MMEAGEYNLIPARENLYSPPPPPQKKKKYQTKKLSTFIFGVEGGGG